jgi:hypothetical protein
MSEHRVPHKFQSGSSKSDNRRAIVVEARLRGGGEKDKALEVFGEHPSASSIGLSVVRLCAQKLTAAMKLTKMKITKLRLTKKRQALLKFLGASLVSTQRLLKGNWFEIEVQGNPGEAKSLLRSELAEKPLARTTNYMALTMCRSKGITDGSRQNRCEQVPLSLYRGISFNILFSLW